VATPKDRLGVEAMGWFGHHLRPNSKKKSNFFSPRGWPNHPLGSCAGLGWPKPPLGSTGLASHPNFFPSFILNYFYYFNFNFLFKS
jgi:hypothetical protein